MGHLLFFGSAIYILKHNKNTVHILKYTLVTSKNTVPHIPMECLSQYLCLVQALCVHPDQAGAPLAATPNLHKDKVPSLARPPDLVAVPGDDWVGQVHRVKDVQYAIGSPTSQCQIMHTNDATHRTNFLGQNVYHPNRICINTHTHTNTQEMHDVLCVRYY